MKNLFVVISLLCLSLIGYTQILPASRSVDWTLAGLRDTTTSGFQVINMQTAGAVGDGTTPNDIVISNALSSITANGAILEFLDGNFLFNHTINLQSNVIIRGQGADKTTFTVDLGGSGNSIDVEGTSLSADTTSLTQTAPKDSSFLLVQDTTGFRVGDWIRIIQLDTDLVTSSWAYNTVGQIVKIKDMLNNRIDLDSPLRMDFNLTRTPYIRKITPIENVGIECIKINRMDSTSPLHFSNINFMYAVNSWVSGIESQNCSYSHIDVVSSSNIYISKSYFHHGFGYGGDGRAYGVMLELTSNECLIEDNIFEHLRHSMIVQAGANGNVFAYNYSKDPFWSLNPSNAAGDMVLHGNYPYANLFEQNICRNIVIDNSHGPNGPHNTFFRNRCEGFGIFFSDTNSPNQNFIGNDIPNTTFPYSLVNYTISGIGHFIYGNNNKGTIDLPGTALLTDQSYAYLAQPNFVSSNQWAGIGTPNIMGANNIPAYDRYTSENIFSSSCNSLTNITEYNLVNKVNIYPNPTLNDFTIESEKSIRKITIKNTLGQIIFLNEQVGYSQVIKTDQWKEGIYFIKVTFLNNDVLFDKIIKID